jgi:rare lipoprotein A
VRLERPPSIAGDHPEVVHARRTLTGVLLVLFSLTLFVGVSAPSPAAPREEEPEPWEPIELQGVASWYGEAFRDRTTACGEPYDPDAITAAHRTLPCWARVRVEHGDRSVVVTITDRGPYVDGRELDLSRAAFERLAPLEEGLIEVRGTVLSP